MMIPFVVSDLEKYQIYLGMPWVDAEDPKLNFRTRRFLHRGSKDKDKRSYQKVAVEDATEFNRTLLDPEADVYYCSVNFVAE